MRKLLPLLGLASVAATVVTITSSSATQSSFTYGVSISTDGLFDGAVEPGPARWTYSGSIPVGSKSVAVSGEVPIPHPPVDELLRDGPELRVQAGESLTLEGGDRYYSSIAIDGTLTVTAPANFYVRGRVRIGKNATVNAPGSTFVQGSCAQAIDDVEENAEENQFRVQGSVTARIEAPDSRVRIVMGASFTGDIAGREVRVQGTAVGSIFAKRSLEIDGRVQGDARCLGNIVVRGRLEGTATAGGTITGAAGSQHVPFAFTIAVSWDSSDVAESVYSATLSLSIRRGTVTLGSSTSTSSVIVDRTPPVLALSPSGTIADRTPTLTATWSDAVAGVDVGSFRATLDGEDATSRFANGSWTAGELPDGVHTFAARIADRVGNVAQTSVRFHVVTALASIGTSGGTLSVADPASPIAGAALEVPEGALPMSVTFTIELISTPAAFPPGFVSSGPVVDFNPSIEFLAPVTVAIPYGDLPPGVPERGVRLLRWDLILQEWVLVPILRVDEERNLVYAQVTRLAGVQFGVAGQIADASRSVVTATATVPADGTSVATVVITPRDIDGLLLGPNQNVSVLLQGIGSASPVMDLGNGAYQAFVVSTVVGLSQARATVNGVELASQPVIRFLKAAPDFFALDVTSPVQAGQASSLTITAKLFSGEILSTFTGTVEIHLTGTAGFYPQVLAATFTPDDLGVLTLPDALVFARAGVQQVKVTYPVKPGVGGFAQVVVLKGLAALVEKFAGDNQTGAPNTRLPEPLVARVTDLFGNPIAGANVDFLFTSGDARFVTGTGGGGGASTIIRVAGGLVEGGSATEAPLDLVPHLPQPIFASVFVGSDGSIYYSDSGSHLIRRVNAAGQVTTVAGRGVVGGDGDGGLALQARLNSPGGLAVDPSGEVLIADYANHRIRKVFSDGFIATIAGNGMAGTSGDGGLATEAQISNPRAVVLDSMGRIYIATISLVRRVDLDGTIATVAGGGSTDGDGIPATQAALKNVSSVALAGDGVLLIGQGEGADRIRKVDLTTGMITTFYSFGSAEPPRPDETLGLAMDAAGNILALRSVEARLYRIDAAASASVVAGTGTHGFSGDGGLAISASLSHPTGVAVDASGNVYIADAGNLRIRRVDGSGIITTYVGNGSATFGGDNGPAATASFSAFGGVAPDAQGNLYIAADARIRRIDSGGAIATIAGDGVPQSTGDGGPASSARVNPSAIVVDASGNIYFAERAQTESKVRVITFDGTIATIGTFTASQDRGEPGPAPMGGPVTLDLAVDSAGNLFAYETENARIQRYSPDTGTWVMVAGTGTRGFSGDGGPATSAQLGGGPEGVIAVDGLGNLWIGDSENDRIRKVDTSGVITTRLEGVRAVALAADASGNAYFARYVYVELPPRPGDPPGPIFTRAGSILQRLAADGSVTTVAGSGQEDDAGDGGPAIDAAIHGVVDLSMDSEGRLLALVTTGGPRGRIRRITLGSGGGVTTSPSTSATTDTDGLAVSFPILLPALQGQSLVDASILDASPVTFTVTAGDPGPGAPTITSPPDGATVLTETPVISGTAPAGATVVVLADGLRIGSAVSDGTWSVTASRLSAGAHTLTAYVPGSIASQPVDIVVSLMPPEAPTITTTPKKTSSTHPRVEGYAAPFVTVVVFADGLEVGSAFSDADGNWSLTTSALPDGAFTITAATRTSALSAPSDAIAIVVDTVPPDPPTNVVASEGNGLVFLTWDPSAAPDTMGYIVWRKLAGDPDSSFTKLHLLPVIGTQYCDHTVTNDVQFCYRVVAVDDAVPEEAP